MEGHGRSWKILEGHGRSRNVMEGHRRSFPIIRLSFQVRKVSGGGVQSAMLVACRIIVTAQSNSDSGFELFGLRLDWTGSGT